MNPWEDNAVGDVSPLAEFSRSVPLCDILMALPSSMVG